MRELLKELKRMGKTIIISSHILKELAEMCNVVGVIERGELLFSGDVREIMRRARVGHVVHVRVTERSEDAAGLLRQAPGVSKVGVSDTDHGVQINLTLDEESPIDASDIPAR